MAVLFNGHDIEHRNHRYECVRCEAVLLSLMQFQTRECRP